MYVAYQDFKEQQIVVWSLLSLTFVSILRIAFVYDEVNILTVLLANMIVVTFLSLFIILYLFVKKTEIKKAVGLGDFLFILNLSMICHCSYLITIILVALLSVILVQLIIYKMKQKHVPLLGYLAPTLIVFIISEFLSSSSIYNPLFNTIFDVK